MASCEHKSVLQCVLCTSLRCIFLPCILCFIVAFACFLHDIGALCELPLFALIMLVWFGATVVALWRWLSENLPKCANERHFVLVTATCYYITWSVRGCHRYSVTFVFFRNADILMKLYQSLQHKYIPLQMTFACQVQKEPYNSNSGWSSLQCV